MITLLIHSQTPQNIEGYLSKKINISNDALLGFIQNTVVNFWKTINKKATAFILAEKYGNNKGCQSIKMYTTNDTQWVLIQKTSQIIIRQTRKNLSRRTNFLNYNSMN